MTTDYQKQAEDFLTRFGIKFRATLSDSKLSTWQPSGHHYRVTLSKASTPRGDGSENYGFPKRLVFDFWGCKSDMENGIKEIPAYDVLACISSDVNCSDTFKDFCSEYGYGEDSIKALQTFKRAHSFAKRLKEFFTTEELEALSEIT